MFIEALFLIIIGLSIGSFLNVLIDRIPNEEPFIRGRSHCDRCKKILAWYDLIPVLSYVFLKGKCRYCYSHINLYYPVIELLTGILFVAAFLRHSEFILPVGRQVSGSYELLSLAQSANYPYLNLIFELFVICSLLIIFFTDLKYGIIPDKVLYPAIIISFLYIILNTRYIMLNNLLSALGAFLFFFVIFLITKGKGIGFGDVKFVFFMGLLLGFPKIVSALYLAFLTGAFVSLILILCRKKSMKDSVPFGPFLAVSSFALFFFGEKIISFFLLVLRL